jgi:hypothetical protein
MFIVEIIYEITTFLDIYALSIKHPKNDWLIGWYQWNRGLRVYENTISTYRSWYIYRYRYIKENKRFEETTHFHYVLYCIIYMCKEKKPRLCNHLNLKF